MEFNPPNKSFFTSALHFMTLAAMEPPAEISSHSHVQNTWLNCFHWVMLCFPDMLLQPDKMSRCESSSEDHQRTSLGPKAILIHRPQEMLSGPDWVFVVQLQKLNAFFMHKMLTSSNTEPRASGNRHVSLKSVSAELSLWIFRFYLRRSPLLLMPAPMLHSPINPKNLNRLF